MGTVTGVLPGLGTSVALSLLLPFTYHMDVLPALLMMSGIIYGVQYGGTITSVLLAIPGSPSTSVTCLDGYPMAQQGRGATALVIAALSSFLGSIIGIAILMTVGPLISEFSFLFGPAEYFSLMVFALVAASVMLQSNVFGNIILVLIGMTLGMIGTDSNSGMVRLTLGSDHLTGGISIVVLAMGIFGIAEIIHRLSSTVQPHHPCSLDICKIDFQKNVSPAFFAAFRGSVIGSFLGALPGIGPTISSFSSYMLEKRVSKTPERFGHGAIEGVSGPEAANNAAAQTAFVPTLTLGIPGDSTMVFIITVLLMQGIIPGPTLIINHPELFWTLVTSFLLGNLFLLVLNIPMIPLWIKFLNIPYRLIYPLLLILMCIGVYTLNNSYLDILMMLCIGVFGYILKQSDYNGAPLLLGFVLGPLMEEYLRRGLTISQGDFSYFVSSPISVVSLLLTVFLLVQSLRSAD